MRYILNAGTSDGLQAAARGPHHIDHGRWEPVAEGEFQLRARLLVRPVGEIIIVRCFSMQEQYDDQETAELGPSLIGLARLGYVRILLNLQGVNFASGALLGSLASLHRELVKARGFLRLFGLEPIVRDALRICRLDTALEIYGSEEEAISAHIRRPVDLESQMTSR
jgi:anti-anti-sigma factor